MSFTPALNNLQTSLVAQVGISDSTVLVTSTTGWPTAGIFSIESEIISYTGVTSGSFTGCARGVDGTAAAMHTLHDTGGIVRKCQLRVVAMHITELQDAVNQILYVAPVANLSLTTSQVEIGATVTSETLNWTWNKTILAQSIDQGIGVLAPNLRTLNLTGLSITSNTTWTLTGDDGVNTATASATLSFLNKRFWGVSSVANPVGTDLDSLSSELSTTRAQSRSLSASAQYMYFAWPSTFGTPTFTVNGLLNTAWVKTTLTYTNLHGHAASYDVYRSTFLQNGTNSVVVS